MIADDDPRHGTLAGHAAGCRQKCCNLAKLRYDKRRRHYGPRTTSDVGTVRRIRALQALGWSLPKIAEAAGLPTRTIANPTFRGSGRVYVTTANAVRKAYDRLSMTLPTGGYAERSRRQAREKGWLPPLMWDDDRIEDPDYRPEPLGTDRRGYRGHLAAEVAHLRASGVSLDQAAKQLGVTVGAVERAMERARSAERQAS